MGYVALGTIVFGMVVIIAVQRKVIRSLKRDNYFLRQEMSKFYRHDS
jgi:hypothetical protein